jgi:hypothetical protein
MGGESKKQGMIALRDAMRVLCDDMGIPIFKRRFGALVGVNQMHSWSDWKPIISNILLQMSLRMFSDFSYY